MKKKSKKVKEDKITFRSCRKINREDGYKMKSVREYTFRGFLEAISSRYKDDRAYALFESDGKEDLSFNDLLLYAKKIGTYLLEHGIKKGDRVAIVGESSPYWAMFYYSVVYIGAVTVPILPDFSRTEVQEILKESMPKLVCVNKKQFKKVYGYEALLVRMEDMVEVPYDILPEFFSSYNGLDIRSIKINEERLNASKPNEEDTASIIFTSGTTGLSKGVELSHMNLIISADESGDVYVKIKRGYKVLSILPFSHCYEFGIGNILTLLRGCEITVLGRPPATSILMKAFKEVKPHIILTVPLLIEKVYKGSVLTTLEKYHKVKKLMNSRLFSSFTHRVIGRKLEQKMGGRIKFFGIGGSALDKDVENFLYKAHFPYAVGYGMTETSPLIAGCGSSPSRHRLARIGEVVSFCDVKVLNKNEEGIGEIVVKGPNVMKGYYNRPELNKTSFTEDGYFITGDLGFIDSTGCLALRGRSKNMILGPAGENIYPEEIESVINRMDYVEESLVLPSNGGLIALVKVDLDTMRKKLGIGIQEAIGEAKKYLSSMRKNANKNLSVASQIQDVELHEEPFEHTPTQKIKRFLYKK